MGSDWQDTTLRSIADFRNGKGLSNTLYCDDGLYPVWGANGQIARTNELLNNMPVIVIGRVGAYCGSVHSVSEPNWVTDNAIFATPKEDIDLRFLYFLLKLLRPERTSIGSAQALVTQSGLKTIECRVPTDSQEQVAIGHVLGTLDDKIELNRKMNETLEAMARAIFKSWFVDFDPVRAKAEGRQPIGMDAETAALFPESFEDSELGEIPKGWKVKAVSTVAEINYGKTLPATKMTEQGFPVYGAAGIVGYYGQAMFRFPVILVTSRGSGSGTVHETCESAFITNNSFSVVPRDRWFSRHYLKFWLKSADIMTRVTGSAQPQLTITNLQSLQVLEPQRPISEAYHLLSDAFWQTAKSRMDESRTLAALRDTLLPKLLSGEIRVKDANSFVRRVV